MYSISSTERDCDLAKKEFHHKLPMSRGPWSDIEEWDKSVYLEPRYVGRQTASSFGRNSRFIDRARELSFTNPFAHCFGAARHHY